MNQPRVLKAFGLMHGGHLKIAVGIAVGSRQKLLVTSDIIQRHTAIKGQIVDPVFSVLPGVILAVREIPLHFFFSQTIRLGLINPFHLGQEFGNRLCVHLPVLPFPGWGADRGKHLHNPFFGASPQQILPRIVPSKLLYPVRNRGKILHAGDIFFLSQKDRELNLGGNPVDSSLPFHGADQIPEQLFPKLIYQSAQIVKKSLFHIRIHREAVQHQHIRPLPCHNLRVQFLKRILPGHRAAFLHACLVLHKNIRILYLISRGRHPYVVAFRQAVDLKPF